MTPDEQADLDEVRAQLDALVIARLDQPLAVLELARYERLLEREAELLEHLGSPSDSR